MVALRRIYAGLDGIIREKLTMIERKSANILSMRTQLVIQGKVCLSVFFCIENDISVFVLTL